MFLNPTLLKKLMSSAYKAGGIRIGHKEEGYIILGGTWGVWLDANYIPNKVKAMIMELAGTLPETDTVFKVSKSNPIPQLEMNFGDYFYLNRSQKLADRAVTLTNMRIVLHGMSESVLQIQDAKELYLLDTYILDLIDLMEIDMEHENTPAGPCTGHVPGMFFWRNAVCTLLLMGKSCPKDNPLLLAVDHIDFKEVKQCL